MSVLARSPALSRTATSTFPAPSGGASLVLTLTPRNRTILILGSSRLAASRAFLALDADANVLISAPGGPSQACDEIKHRLEQGQIGWLDFDQCERVQSVEAWTAALEQLGTDLSLVCLTDTVLDASGSSPSLTSDTHTKSSRRRSLASIQALRSACIALRLPLNVADHPSLSDFSFPSMHRFPLDPSTPKSPMSSLQIAISTSGKGCRLATRLKREVVARLPRGVGRAVDNVGRLRDRARLGGFNSSPKTIPVKFDGGHGEDDLPSSPHVPLNSPVPQLHARPSASASTSGATTPSTSASAASAASSLFSFENEEETKRRMRWVAQVSEYWPIEYLANMKDSEFEAVLGRYASKGIVDEGFSELVDATMPLESQQTTSSNSEAQHTASPSTNGAAGSSAQASTPSSSIPTSSADPSITHSLLIRPPSPPPHSQQGTIHLVGSGPGHPSLLTMAAHKSLQSATLVLSDKLVPSEILALIPSTTTLHIAKKFPGNAEGAQNEMMALALEGARRGERVVRLKQGDPYVYGRGGEEVLFFREHGFESLVIPGVSSALAGPLMFNVPVTQRGVAESMVLCTGVGRKGKSVSLPGYERARTLLVLMGVARLKSVLRVLQQPQGASSVEGEDDAGSRDGHAYPPWTPIAIIERASSADQRMTASTLGGIEQALERVGDQRPPGMMVIGWACLALAGKGDVGVLDDGLEGEEADRARVNRWLGEDGYLIKEGLDDGWKQFL